MKWIDDLITWFAHIAGRFWEAYFSLDDWTIAPWPLTKAFYFLANAFDNIVAHFLDFRQWAHTITNTVSEVLSLETVKEELQTWLEWAQWSWEWIESADDYINAWITAWWTSTMVAVQGWIQAAKDDLNTLIGNVGSSLASLQTTWDNFWTVTWPGLLASFNNLKSSYDSFVISTLPGLATWAGVGSLVESTLREWLPFYDDLSRLWTSIAEFIVDPWGYLTDRFVNWFLGPEV